MEGVVVVAAAARERIDPTTMACSCKFSPAPSSFSPRLPPVVAAPGIAIGSAPWRTLMYTPVFSPYRMPTSPATLSSSRAFRPLSLARGALAGPSLGFVNPADYGWSDADLNQVDFSDVSQQIPGTSMPAGMPGMPGIPGFPGGATGGPEQCTGEEFPVYDPVTKKFLGCGMYTGEQDCPPGSVPATGKNGEVTCGYYGGTGSGGGAGAGGGGGTLQIPGLPGTLPGSLPGTFPGIPGGTTGGGTTPPVTTPPGGEYGRQTPIIDPTEPQPSRAGISGTTLAALGIGAAVVVLLLANKKKRAV